MIQSLLLHIQSVCQKRMRNEELGMRNVFFVISRMGLIGRIGRIGRCIKQKTQLFCGVASFIVY